MATVKQGPGWTRVTAQAGWQARDSMGEFVYDDHLWILGGWHSSHTPNPRDVWKSADGRRWECVVEVAPWEHSDLSASMAFRDRMWFMGGRKLPGAENSCMVWSSEDGADWRLETSDPGWCPRVAMAFAVFDDRMWILGGTENFYDHSEAMIHDDVWSTADGVHWEQTTPHAGWSPRAHAQALAFDGKLWLMGGGLWHPQHVAGNDVWCSKDGVHWHCVTRAAPWPPRLWFSAVAYRDRMWVLGGWSRGHGNFGDVWHSADGCQWTQMECDPMWSRRHEFSAYVFQDKLWVAGGYAEQLSSEVWNVEMPPLESEDE